MSDWVRDLSGMDISEATFESLHVAGANIVSTQASNPEQVLGPTKEYFKVPSNRIEHDLFVSRLVQSGLTGADAEQVLVSRKAAFNRACREFKKETTKAGKSHKPNQVKMSTSNHKAMQTKIGTLNLCLQKTELEINVDQNLMSFNGFFMNQKIKTFVGESAATSMLIFLT
jgi:hypothetical protein